MINAFWLVVEFNSRDLSGLLYAQSVKFNALFFEAAHTNLPLNEDDCSLTFSTLQIIEKEVPVHFLSVFRSDLEDVRC